MPLENVAAENRKHDAGIVRDMAVAFIGLGSNLNQPEQQLRAAKQALDLLPGTRILADSGLFLSRAMTLPGDQRPQPDYVNAVIKLETELAPEALLDALQAIENQQGRERVERWGPRTLDLDILLYENLTMHTPRLTIPHGGLAERDFVVHPMFKIDQNLEVPGHGPLSQLVEKVSDEHIQYLGAF